MNKARDVYDAEMAAIEVEHKKALVRFGEVVADPTSAPTSELLSMFVGLTMGSALGVPNPAIGTEEERDAALGTVALELDRRIPRPS